LFQFINNSASALNSANFYNFASTSKTLTSLISPTEFYVQVPSTPLRSISEIHTSPATDSVYYVIQLLAFGTHREHVPGDQRTQILIKCFTLLCFFLRQNFQFTINLLLLLITIIITIKP